MHELYEELTDICEVLSDELAKTNDKLEKSGGELTAGDLDYIDKLTHAIKSIKTTKAMMESEGYSNNMSYARGRTGNVRRDAMGRYSRMGYSNDTVSELRDIMHNAPDEMSRREIEKLIHKMERM